MRDNFDSQQGPVQGHTPGFRDGSLMPHLSCHSGLPGPPASPQPTTHSLGRRSRTSSALALWQLASLLLQQTHWTHYTGTSKWLPKMESFILKIQIHTFLEKTENDMKFSYTML